MTTRKDPLQDDQDIIDECGQASYEDNLGEILLNLLAAVSRKRLSN